MVPGRRLPPLQRPPGQPENEMGPRGGDVRFSRTHQQRQWPHPRPPGQAGGLRGWHPESRPHRARRHQHRRGQLLSGHASEPPQRRGGQVRWQHLLHRSRGSRPGPGPGLLGDLPGLSRPGHDHTGGTGPRLSQRGWPSPRTRASSTSTTTAGGTSGPSACSPAGPWPWRRTASSAS